MSSINLEEFHGLKCSRHHCGGDAEIYEDYEIIGVRCKTCMNKQTLFSLYTMCEECHEGESAA